MPCPQLVPRVNRGPPSTARAADKARAATAPRALPRVPHRAHKKVPSRTEMRFRCLSALDSCPTDSIQRLTPTILDGDHRVPARSRPFSEFSRVGCESSTWGEDRAIRGSTG